MSKILDLPQTNIYQLKITLQGSKPRIWRRFLVPGNYRLSKLHRVIQIVMGWYEAHLHEFIYHGISFGEPSPEYEEGRMLDHKKMTLEGLIREAKKEFTYIYDFGDGWQHEIVVEKIFMPEHGVRYPVCLKGERACPPEDCGGIGGYGYLLEAMKNPKTQEDREFAEWAGDYDPEFFDLERINMRLRKMR
jgi:hypothetical protein